MESKAGERNLIPERIRLRRDAGWRKPFDVIKVDRGTKWGNPFRSTQRGGRVAPAGVYVQDGRWELAGEDWSEEDVVALFESWMTSKPVVTRAGVERSAACYALPPPPSLSLLIGRRLACWCPMSMPCHADVLLRLANGWQFDRGQFTQARGDTAAVGIHASDSIPTAAATGQNKPKGSARIWPPASAPPPPAPTPPSALEVYIELESLYGHWPALAALSHA